MRVAALVLALMFPAAASASTASLRVVPGPCDIVCSKYAGMGAPLAVFDYTAAPGEANALSLSLKDATLTVSDPGAAVTPGENCTRVDDHTATCQTAGQVPSGYTVALGDGDDSLAVTGPGSAAGMRAFGGPGDDQLTGGAELDTFDGAEGRDRVSTGAGDDVIVDGTGADADVLDGGPDRDRLDLSARTTPAIVDLAAGTGPDGDTLTSLEDVSGGKGNDALTGNDRPNALTGGAGDDLIKGGAGNDYLAGGPGRDIFAAGLGADEIATRDGTGDTVACGDGRDKVRDLADGTPDSEYGESTPYTVGPDLDDVLDLDCELTIFGARRDVDGTLAQAPPVRFTKHVLVLRLPCTCKGTVTARNALFALGSARFTGRARTVVVRSPRRRFEGVVELRWRSGSRTGAWSVELPGPK